MVVVAFCGHAQEFWGLHIGVELLRQAGAAVWTVSSSSVVELSRLRGVQKLTDPELRGFFDRDGALADQFCDGEALLSADVLPFRHSSRRRPTGTTGRQRRSSLRAWWRRRGGRGHGSNRSAGVDDLTLGRQNFLRATFHRLLVAFRRCPQLVGAYMSFEWQVLTESLADIVAVASAAKQGESFAGELTDPARLATAQHLLARHRQQARSICRGVLAASPLAQHDLSVWVAYARCEWRCVACSTCVVLLFNPSHPSGGAVQ